MLIRQAERFPQKPLVSAGNTEWSYADACSAAARSAANLHSAGIRQGDRVALICSNRIEFLELALGCAWLGAVAVPINVASRGPQLQHILVNSGARLLVLEASYAENLGLLDPCRAGDRSSLAHRCRSQSTTRPRRRDCAAADNREDRGRAGPAWRSRFHSLYVRHDRPIEGSLLSACAVFLVGGQYGVLA
jgi:acyl-CoA synthetase (AMP-forming)/AMP-acid ligase II